MGAIVERDLKSALVISIVLHSAIGVFNLHGSIEGCRSLYLLLPLCLSLFLDALYGLCSFNLSHSLLLGCESSSLLINGLLFFLVFLLNFDSAGLGLRSLESSLLFGNLLGLQLASLLFCGLLSLSLGLGLSHTGLFFLETLGLGHSLGFSHTGLFLCNALSLSHTGLFFLETLGLKHAGLLVCDPLSLSHTGLLLSHSLGLSHTGLLFSHSLGLKHASLLFCDPLSLNLSRMHGLLLSNSLSLLMPALLRMPFSFDTSDLSHSQFLSDSLCLLFVS